MEDKTLLNVKEVATILEIQPPAVRALIKRNRLKATKFNNSYVIKKEDLNEFIKERGRTQ